MINNRKYMITCDFGKITPMTRAVNKLGGVTRTSEKLNCSKAAVSLWVQTNDVPVKRALQLAKLTGIPARDFIRRDKQRKMLRLEKVIALKISQPVEEAFV